MALPGLTSPNPGVPVDPDNWPLCGSCLHDLRTHVAELHRLEREGADPDEVTDRKRVILRLQSHLSYAVRDLLTVRRTSPA